MFKIHDKVKLVDDPKSRYSKEKRESFDYGIIIDFDEYNRALIQFYYKDGTKKEGSNNAWINKTQYQIIEIEYYSVIEDIEKDLYKLEGKILKNLKKSL